MRHLFALRALSLNTAHVGLRALFDSRAMIEVKKGICQGYTAFRVHLALNPRKLQTAQAASTNPVYCKPLLVLMARVGFLGMLILRVSAAQSMLFDAVLSHSKTVLPK